MSGKQHASRYPGAPPAHDANHGGKARRRHPHPEPALTHSPPELEPRRSVRATKGQHTKPFEQFDHPDAPKRRGSSKRGSSSKKATPTPTADVKEEEQENENEDDEHIRCVCGADEQDEDSGEAWIACDTCGAWQHNVCMGMSVFTEDVPDMYYCELCKPEMHTELLEGIARGERPWEARRATHDAEGGRKKKRGRKGGRGKRVSDHKDKEKDKDKEVTPSVASKTPPASEVKKDKKEPAKQTGKRKSRDESQDMESQVRTPRTSITLHVLTATQETTPAQKMQKVSETKVVATSNYTPPEDLATSPADLDAHRQGPVKLLIKFMTPALENAVKQGNCALPEGETVESKAERHALQIERAVFDSHPSGKRYTEQCRSLSFNLKNNEDLASNVFNGKMSPTALATMTSGDLASKELQREMAEMKARVDKQSILIADERPRMRRTHKGDELVEDDFEHLPEEETSSFAPAARERGRGDDKKGSEESEGRGRPALSVETRQSPRASDFDFNKVLSSVRSPEMHSHSRRPSGGTFGPTSGPGVDADVDRMLQDENDSEPYSPTEDNDPDVVWRGSVAMNSLADFPATIKYVGGANLPAEKVVPWSSLVPRRLSVAGRIDQQLAIEYLCGLRYNQLSDVVVASIAPASEAYRGEFEAVYKYFVSKQRYGVVGDKGVANVRDTYLVPVVPGEGNHPEFMLNLATNLIPQKRSQPMLLAVFVYRDEARLNRRSPPPSAGPPSASPLVAQGGFPTPTGASSNFRLPSTPTTPAPVDDRAVLQAQGQKMAAEILGPYRASPTVQFLLPQAYQMTRSEWEIIRELLGGDERAREDLQHLSLLLDRHQRGKAAAV
ncbi:MAG: hypothetical protein IMZ46_09995 [Acidobacteria bacterium]|nr:hypothetical protein [Acidobacteriota bacterium]